MMYEMVTKDNDKAAKRRSLDINEKKFKNTFMSPASPKSIGDPHCILSPYYAQTKTDFVNAHSFKYQYVVYSVTFDWMIGL